MATRAGFIIVIIGSPGTGKSFLAKKLADYIGGVSILEGEDFPPQILETFRTGKGQFETLLWFRNKCIESMEDAIKLKEKGHIVVMDTFLLSNELHIPVMSSGFMQEVLLKQADIDNKYIPKPDIVVFLDASEQKILQLVSKRDRDFEQDQSFMRRIFAIKRVHDDFLKSGKHDFVYIKRDQLDFNKESDLKKVVELIKCRLKNA